ncbi:MAG TPA: hypothetical protein VK419_11065 [Bryobacteraceae bacterium]|nr:hypothetical protein [Bryobacteraceae bacterium]
MGSVSSTNPGVANLLQTLSNVSSPALSSPAIVSALEQASPTDVVQLSDAAMQLEVVDQMYGISEGSSASSGSSFTSVLANLESSVLASVPSAASGSPTTASPAASATNDQTALQSAEDQTLLGAGSTGSPSDSLFSFLG